MDDSDPPAVVLDFGSFTSRIGFSGEDNPITYDGAQTGIDKGKIEDYDKFENNLSFAFEEKLKTEAKDKSIVFIINHSLDKKEKLAEVLFEKYQIGELALPTSIQLIPLHYYIEKGVVVESGNSITSIATVLDFKVVESSIKSLDIGSQDLKSYLAKLSPSLPQSHVENVFKTHCCLDTRWNAPNTSAYYKADDLQIHLTNELHQSTEPLFQPDLIGNTNDGIGMMLYNSIRANDVSIRHILYGNVMVAGGATLIPGFPSRLNYEMWAVGPDCRMAIKDSPERQFSAWIGGSLYGCISTTKDKFLKRGDFEEFGSVLLKHKVF